MTIYLINRNITLVKSLVPNLMTKNSLYTRLVISKKSLKILESLNLKGTQKNWTKLLSDHSLSVYNLPEK